MLAHCGPNAFQVDPRERPHATNRESDQHVRYFKGARLSSRLRTLLRKPDRTESENAEMQQLLLDHMKLVGERDERARHRRARRDELLRHLDPIERLWGRIVWPVLALWNTMMLVLHDLLKAAPGRLRAITARLRGKRR